MLLKIKTFGFHKNYTRRERKFLDEIIHLKKIYKFTSEHFLFGHVLFVLIIKNFIKNEKFYFAPNLYLIRL